MKKLSFILRKVGRYFVCLATFLSYLFKYVCETNKHSNPNISSKDENLNKEDYKDE